MFGISVGAVAVERGIDARTDALPLAAQVLEPPLALRRHRVVDALASVDAFAARLQRAAFLERVQDRVDDALAEADGLARDEAHRFDDLVAVHLTPAQHSQNEQLRHTGQEWRIRLCHGSDDRLKFVYWPVRFADRITLSFRS